MSGEIVIISDGEDDEIAFVGITQPKSGPSRPILIDSDSEDDHDLHAFLQASLISTSGDSVGGIKVDRKGRGKATLSDAVTTGFLAELDALRNKVPSPPPIPEAVERRPKAKRKSSGGESQGEKRPKSGDVDEATKAKPSKEEKEALKAKEKQEKQLLKDAQKSYQRKLAEVNRLRTSKNDVVREIHLYLSADLESPSAPIAAALPEIRTRIADNHSEIRFLPESESPIPGVIRFKRHLKAKWDPAKKQFIPLDEPRWVWESTILVIINAEELVDKIAAGEEELSTWASDVRLTLGLSSKEQMMVMIKGLQKYYSKTKSLANKEFAAAARAGLDGLATASKQTLPSRPPKERIEMEMVKLQVAERCFLVHEDMEDWVYNIAADVALRPYKLISKSHLNFCPTDGIKKGGNPTEVFELMLQEVQGITPSAAVGIAEEYPTFKDLMEAFEDAERRGGAAKGELMLQDCEIKTLRNGTANGRKLNKALAKRVYNVFRGEDSLALA
ncbi:hypothetical protein CI109_106974 [Kwoniella shandongensis]|uniref:ERCC4 domain-containing protein n=1 Tax=Kwoniella shandongensis TaxID=1734106 RepID=A0AAJ8N155_9TREE